MPKKNQFYGAIMSQSTVSAYYPSNPDFDHFVFQQMIEDGSDPDDNYTLIAYAVNNTGLPILLPPLTASNGTPYKAPKRVQFANMKLGKAGLNSLYSGVVTSDLTINPTSPYGSTDYVAYTAYTVGSGAAGNNYPINPSPPA